MSKRIIDDPRPFRILSVALLIAGYVWIYRPSEDMRATLLEAAQTNTMQAQFGEETLRRRPRYEKQAEQIRMELGQLRLDASDTETFAAFLVDVDADAQREGVAVRGVAPQHDGAPPGEAALQLHVRGRYPALAAFIDNLSRARTLTRVNALRIARTDEAVQSGATPELDATIAADLVPVRAHSTGVNL